jgi:diketogulonate reductase-like aldo/keto reductase
MIERIIPSTGETIPVVGLGTWQRFDVGPTEHERQPLREALQTMAGRGARIIDSSPMYGRSEKVVGHLTNELNLADKFFYATKVWTEGEREGVAQMDASMHKMQRTKMDLIQIHNLVHWQTHLKTLRRWKDDGKIRYLGITHYTVASHPQLEQIVRSEKLDFVQFNYSIRIRNAELSLLKAAQDRGVAVIVNEPLEKGALFGLVRNKAVPEWAVEHGIDTWTKFFLTYVLAHSAVTCVIPATSNPNHMEENLQAGETPLPNEATRKKMAEFVDRL